MIGKLKELVKYLYQNQKDKGMAQLHEDMYSSTEKDRAYKLNDAPTPAYAAERAIGQKSEHYAVNGATESERTMIERLQRENAALRMRVSAVIELHLQMQSQFFSLQQSQRHVQETEAEMQRLRDQFEKLTAEFIQY